MAAATKIIEQPQAKKRVYSFAEGNKDMRDLLGGKGANLAEMTNLGMPVPPGFSITTEVCREYLKRGRKLPPTLMDEVRAALAQVEKGLGKKFGSPRNPLLVSVRSGAKFSMPGMMDTILNLGLNDQTLKVLERLTGNRRFALDAYRRLIMMFGSVVMGVDRKKHFEAAFEALKERLGVTEDTKVGAKDLEELVGTFKEIVKRETGREFPQDPHEQLEMSIKAVFESWNNRRAIEYRRDNKIPQDLGTAVNVQAMVFGNIGEDSGTGVAFTRDSATGEHVLYGDYLANAQGEDVVAGIRATMPIQELGRHMPKVYGELKKYANKLEKHYRDLQDIEFTVEAGRLFVLQTRSGKRAGQAAVKIAVDMAQEGLISKEEAIERVSAEQLEQSMHPQIDPAYKVRPLAIGVPASPGAACGKAIFDADRAAEQGAAGEQIILVREETNPDDVHGLAQAQGVLTARGGKTSHAAIVATGMGKPAVVGCDALVVDEGARQFTCNGVVVKEDDLITIDGSSGRVHVGRVPTVPPSMGKEFWQLLRWADKMRRLGVRANADTPEDAATAFRYGAEGVGLCRTEHMFMDEDRLPVVQEMIMAVSVQERKKALDKLLPMQREDFIGIFKAMKGRPVTIRLLDPPLHEFLPREEQLIEDVTRLRLTEPDSAELKRFESLLVRVNALKEANPMLGLRGCRLGIIFPDINEMQVRAIFEAACRLKKQGVEVRTEVMIPLVGHINELKTVRDQLEKLAKKVMKENGVEVEYSFGTMVELPRAALTADEIAESAQFFSFGTNDLTQTVFGFSRDDAEAKFIYQYLEKGILPVNPFQTIDETGVGKLMRMAVELGKKTRPDIKLGICGEHGGDPASIHFCHKIGLHYVSCSPYRVPVARLAAAHAALEDKSGAKARADV